ncbi:ABC-2 type transport system permease protein [Lentzea waywayandensis]|uniref:ABC-2 type transport system permease protein n=1 Tax=Lentzea waywayandensis TaxID=84724 RepID=A0A1I6CVG7_9PSEU|nr:ABC transporter permease [Lentzea waywayandensis]SFQ97122.1 ABC-2 type transport system permease protein [Lentzea waywayandensis]
MTGTWQLVRLALRRDRILLPVWVLFLAGVTYSTTTALEELYNTQQSRDLLGATANANSAFLAMLGPLHDWSSLGGLVVWRWGVFSGLFIAIMAMLVVTRHTRAEEEAGRTELVAATVVGRHAPLAAAVIVAGGTSLLIGLLQALALTGKGLAPAGAFAFGLSTASVGLVFTGVSALTAQLSENSRVSNAIAGGFLGVTYLLRAAGDAAGESGPQWLTWFSPIGWTEHVRSFADNRFWVLLLPLAAFVLLVGVSSYIVTRRDVGLGLLPARLGPPHSTISTPFGLAWRLQKGSLIGWSIALFAVGVIYGSVAQAVGQMVQDNPTLGQIVSKIGGADAMVDAFFATVTQLIGLIASIYLVQAILRLRSEETSFRAEPILATPVSRWSWVASHVVFALVGGAVVLAASGLGLGLVYGLQIDDLGTVVPQMLGAALAQLPAAWVIAGVALVLFGLFPQLTGVSWAVVSASLVITLLGPALQLDQWVIDVSPFTHVPKYPDITFGPLAWLTVVAVVLLAAGFAGFRRRDLTT